MARPLDGYQTVRFLGAGGFGEVVLARHLALDRMVAVKRIHRQALAGSDDLERFRREAVVLATLEHPAVVRVYDFRSDGGDAVLVMEYVEGSSLLELMERGPVPVDAALRALSDVAAALEAGAALGIAHRDVKPGNVFVLPDGHAKLGDFGLARVVSDPSVFRTSDGSSIGTPAYFPPESGHGLSEPDARSDAYSFAVMAYEALTGRLPFEGLNAVAMIAAHWSQQPPAPVDLVPGFPPAASEALMQGLAKDPAERPLPTELVRRLAAVPAEDWPPPPGPVASGAAPPTVVVRPPSAPVPVPVVGAARRRRWPWALAATLFLGAAGYALTRPQAAEPLEVTDVSVTAAPETGRCPTATYVFHSTLRTNGSAGTVTGSWTGPDGKAAPVFQLRAAAGQSSLSTAFEVTVTGSRPLRGTATLTLSSPTTLTQVSPTIGYSC